MPDLFLGSPLRLLGTVKDWRPRLAAAVMQICQWCGAILIAASQQFQCYLCPTVTNCRGRALVVSEGTIPDHRPDSGPERMSVMDATISAPGKSVAPFSTLFELSNMQLPKFDLSKMEGLEAFRDAAEKGVAQAKDAYEKVKTTAEEASKLLEDAYASSAKSALAYNRKVIEAGRSNVNASLDYALALMAAKSLSEVVELSAAHVRDQLAAAIQQAEEFTVIVRNAATETVEPIRMGVNKAFQKAA